MFGIKRHNGKVVITKSTIPTSPTGRQLVNALLEQSPDVVHQSPATIAMDNRVKEKVASTMAESNVRVAAIVQSTKDNAPAPKVKGSNQPNLQAAVAGLGDVQTFVRDPFTGEPCYGKDAKFPTLKGGYFIPNDDPSEGYYLLFNEGMTFILTAGQSRGDYMSVLYRAGSGNVSKADMESIIKAKLPLSKVKQYYKIVTPTTHYNPAAVEGEPWTILGKVDWINPTFITIKQLFRMDCPSATIVW